MNLSNLRFLGLPREGRAALWVTCGYVVIAGTWLFFSHALPEELTNDPVLLPRLQVAFDLALIAITGIVLFVSVRRFLTTFNQQEDRIHQMIAGACAATGEEFFHSLVRSLAETVGADYAFVCELHDESRQKVRTVAVCSHGQIAENFEFALAGTPCQEVLSGGIRCYPRGVRQSFPLDHLAEEMGIESYAGIPLVDFRGEVMGLMSVFGRHPLRRRQLAESMLRLFAVRAAGELERKRAEQTINHIRNSDALTGLPNRRRFNEQLARTLTTDSEEPLAVLFIDLDRFKTINDTLGHAVGDWLLREVGGRLTASLRHHDIVARLGGDEFMILLSGFRHTSDVALIAGKILKSLEPPFCFSGMDLHIGLSIGIALYPFDGKDPETLMKNADTAMNRAKELGRNNYQFYRSEMNASSLVRLGMENQLRKALDRGEFVLHYQPQYDLAAGSMAGVEALIRWNHPDRGLLGPNEFISMAEETGLIVAMGEWVLRTACQDFRGWQQSGSAPGRVAVNISARQFLERDLVDHVGQVLQETGVSADCLEFEITESLTLKNVAESIERLHGLRRLGIRISIDDFGTGYSSLSYLRQFPINNIKIDRSFLKDFGQEADSSGLVRAIISMARSLHLDVVAEGVEREDQLHFLRSHGCDKIQGFLLSPPVAPEKIPAMASRPIPLPARTGATPFRPVVVK